MCVGKIVDTVNGTSWSLVSLRKHRSLAGADFLAAHIRLAVGSPDKPCPSGPGTSPFLFDINLEIIAVCSALNSGRGRGRGRCSPLDSPPAPGLNAKCAEQLNSTGSSQQLSG